MTLTGLATGIGSLPYADPEPALDLIFRYCPRIPFWPQLPKRGASESMVAQFSENIPCLRFTQEGVVFDGRNQDHEMELFYDRLIAQDVDHFAISEGYAPGLRSFRRKLETRDLSPVSAIKFHVTGPFTFAASINDAEGRPLLYDEVFMQAVVKGLIMKAAWQVKQFRAFGKPMIIFIDEPYLAGFGSAYTAVNKEDVLSVLKEFCSALAADGLHIGIHCCGNTDWSLFTAIEGLEIINFDAFDFLERVVLYASDLKGFFERGGSLCWGIVPTQLEDKGRGLTKDILVAKLRSGIKLLSAKGVDERLIKEQLLVSPACGLGSQTIASAQTVFKLLSEVSDAMRSNSLV
jgi:methionine synthase II (cobalamin-independent)